MMLVLLAALVTASAVAAPFFVYASVEKLSALDVAAAPAAQREVTVSRDISLQSNGAATLSGEFASIPDVLRLPDFTGVTSVRISSLVGPETGPAVSFLSYREGVCDHVAVQGVCPTAAGDAMISAAAAAFAGVHLGSTLAVSSATFPKPIPLHVVGVYAARNPDDPYWGHSTLEGQVSQLVTAGYHSTDAVFVTEPTIIATSATSATVDRDMVLGNGSLTVHDSIADADAVFAAAGALSSRGYVVTSAIRDLSNTVIIDTNQIFIGVPIGAVELVVFGWFALFFSIRATAQARRFDIGILKLRGVRRRSLWKLVTEQSALPLAAGLPFGLVLGFFGARAVAGPVVARGDQLTAITLATAAAIVAVVGGLLAALIAERSALATPVGELLRSTPARRRTWAANVIDLILVAIAVVGVIQIHTLGSADGAALSAVAPVVVAFAVGLIATRLLTPMARRAVAVTRRTGRSRGLLAATYLARRPGLDRLVSLLTIAVALCGYSIMAGTAGAQARSARSTLEVGAAKVLIVGPVAPMRLVAAVRAADPSGRYAMAATELDADNVAVLAVDSTRLAAVVPPGAPGDGDPAAIAALIRPTPTRSISISGTDLRLSVDTLALPEGRKPAYAVASMVTSAGYAFASFGPLVAGARTYPGTATGCSPASECELVGFQLTAGPSSGDPISPVAASGTSIVVTDLQAAGSDRPVIDAISLGTLPWRTTSNPQAIGPNIQASTAGLRLTIPPATYGQALTMDPTAYLPSAPVVVPAITTGRPLEASAGGLPTIRPFGFDPVFIRVVATRAVLPRLEHGVLVDLDYVQALVGADNGEQTSEVWLSSDAPPAITSALAKQGLVSEGTESIADRTDAYANEPAVVGLRFQELGGVLALAIAAAVLLLVASVECRPRGRELAALRRQGVPLKVIRDTTFLIYGVIAGGAFVAGTLGGMADRLLANNGPLFRDGWHLLARPPALPPVAVAVTLAGTGLTLAVAAFVAAHQVVRAQAVEGQVTSG